MGQATEGYFAVLYRLLLGDAGIPPEGGILVWEARQDRFRVS
jgi:hypothetical protein